MAILSLPSSPRFMSAQFGLVPITWTFTSFANGASQTVARPGNAWKLDVSVRPIFMDSEPTLAADWLTFLDQLEGQAGRFYAGDPWLLAPRGAAKDTPGTPQVAGASQTGKTLTIDGAPISTTGYLLKGDMIAFDLPSGLRSLQRVQADVDSDAGGVVSAIPIRPGLRESPADNATILLSPATGVFRLVDDNQGAPPIERDGRLTIAFSAIESFNLGE